MKKRLAIISFFLIMFVTFIVIWDQSYYEGLTEVKILPLVNTSGHLDSEAKTFKRSNFALDYSRMPADKKYERSLKSYYENRAFPGAPPYIPHPVKDDSIGENKCLQCHLNGGFVEKYQAYAPVTPHPEMPNCRQCHVLKVSSGLFVATNFKQEDPPAVGKGANNFLEESPPQIPHSLQLRENCLACHAGPAAPKEIKMSHPERINCRQCHVPKSKEDVEYTFHRNN